MSRRSSVVILEHLVLGLALIAAMPARSARAQAATFTLAISPGTQRLSAGGIVMFTVTSASKGPSQSLDLSMSALPSGISASFKPVSILSGQASTLTLSASSSAMNGLVLFAVTGTASQSLASAIAKGSVTVSGGANAGGPAGCPAGSIDVGGVCVPVGCSFAPGRKWDETAVAFCGLLLFAAARRSRARRG